ncbi:hypothetical protein C8Q69DRAFT_507835 [Paecilomyces variotii]|uniref:GPI ethanolamine phosphate transferase 2 n=1 Tax=Byssochlamys spectabilis TaxID=264951 RepID=A0A443HRN1_BYSSP|nr:hypothetical protein C8Q69DRAFT_507835 [Paecilomyces variotii]RWQ94464.1 hypothetical protein C8Q69DRAFT_507835 [Paecilomyces variotii]
MAVIWGLDLHEMQWSKFKSSYMFNKIYHLRRTKMVVYQLAMILCVCSESVGTAALADYTDQQSFVENLNNLAAVYNDDFVGIASYNIFVGVAVATIFGAAFFFDLFWPERHESAAVRLAWKISAVVISIMCLADAIAMTVIVATRRSYVTGVDANEARRLLDQAQKHPNLIYRHNPYCIACVVLLWCGLVATIASAFILFASHHHDDKHGVFSKEGKAERDAAIEEPKADITAV